MLPKIARHAYNICMILKMCQTILGHYILNGLRFPSSVSSLSKKGQKRSNFYNISSLVKSWKSNMTLEVVVVMAIDFFFNFRYLVFWLVTIPSFMHIPTKCADFCGSHTIAVLVGLVPRAIVPSLVRIFFVVGILGVQTFFLMGIS